MTGAQEIDAAAELRGTRVLVTGGAGVIARDLLEQLSARGAVVLSVDRLPLDRPAPEGVEHLVADLADADLGPIAAFAPSTILHLAATFERSVESAEFWDQNWLDNVVVTHRLAEMASGLPGVGAFVFASSYLIYRTGQYLFSTPQDEGVALAEDSDIGPRNLCGAAKLYGEAELAFARDVLRGGFRTVAARIFRVYGRGSRDVVSRWVRAALRGDTVDVYHPENRFDYVYSGDVAEGLLRMAINPRADGVLNLATGRARPVSDVIAAIETRDGSPARPPHPRRRAVRGQPSGCQPPPRGPDVEPGDGARGRCRRAWWRTNERPWPSDARRSMSAPEALVAEEAANVRLIVDPVWGYRRVEPLPTSDELDRFYESDYRDLIVQGGRAPELARLVVDGTRRGPRTLVVGGHRLRRRRRFAGVVGWTRGCRGVARDRLRNRASSCAS